MIKIKWTDRAANGEVFQREKEVRSLLKILQNRRHSWIGHTVGHNEFVAKSLKEQYLGEDLDCSTYSKWTETEQLTVIKQ